MSASKYRGVKRLVEDASPLIESKKQRRGRPSGGGKAPTNLKPSTSANLLATTPITKGSTPGVFTTPKTTFATNSDSEDEEFWTPLPAYEESNTLPSTDQVESSQSSPKRPEDFQVCKRLFTAGGVDEKTEIHIVDDQEDIEKFEGKQSKHVFKTDDECDSDKSSSDDESDYELEYETVSRTELWFEEHVPLDFNFHTAQVHLNDFLTRLRRDQKLFEEIDDIDPNLDKGPLTEHELFLARKAKKEKELMKEIEQHEDIINVKRKKSNPSHSDSEDSCNHEDEVDKHTTDVKKKIIDGDEELKEEERIPEECRNLPELNSLIRVEQFIDDLPSSAGYSCSQESIDSLEDFYYHSTSYDNDSQYTADSYPRGKTLKKGSGGDVKLIGITGLKKVETTTKDDYMDCSSLEDLNETEMIVSRPVIKPRKITMSKEPVVSKYKEVKRILIPNQPPEHMELSEHEEFTPTKRVKEHVVLSQDLVWQCVKDKCRPDPEMEQVIHLSLKKCFRVLEENYWYDLTFKNQFAQSFLTGGLVHNGVPIWQSAFEKELDQQDPKSATAPNNNSRTTDLDQDLEFAGKKCLEILTRSLATMEKFQGRMRGPLPSPRCIDLWTDIMVDDGLDELALGLEEGWLTLIEHYNLYINETWYPPAPAFNKIMLDGVRDMTNNCVRLQVFHSLNYTFTNIRPGPDDPVASRIYYESMNKLIYPKRKIKESDNNTAWEFLCNLLENFEREESKFAENELPANRSTNQFLIKINNDEIPTSLINISGHNLLLAFWIQVLETDLAGWVQYYTVSNQIAMKDLVHRPLLARVIFSESTDMQWNRRSKELCSYYVSSLVHGTDNIFHGYIRKLVCLTAKLLALGNLESKGENTLQVTRLARSIANMIFDEKDLIDSSVLERELSLLDPSWLSSSISTYLLCELTGTSISDVATFNDIFQQFINVSATEDDNEQADSSSQNSDNEGGPVPSTSRGFSTPSTSQGTPVPSTSQGALRRTSSGKFSVTISPKTSKTTRKIDLNKRNQYGEVPLHTACKRGKLEQLKQILSTPGVSVNVKDNNNNTPLHEAVVHGNEEAVILLLNFKPYPSVKNMFAAAKTTPDKSGPDKTSSFVDILATDLNGESPVHCAVVNNQPKILEIILQNVEKEDRKRLNKPTMKTKFPSLRRVLDHETSQGVKLRDLNPESADLHAILDRFESVADQIEMELRTKGRPVSNSISVEIMKSPLFSIFIRNSMERYISSQRLFTAYRISKLSSLLEKGEDERGTNYELERYNMFGLNLADDADTNLGVTVSRFGAPFTSFDLIIHKEEKLKLLDMKMVENIIYYWMKVPLMDARNPCLMVPNLLFPSRTMSSEFLQRYLDHANTVKEDK